MGWCKDFKRLKQLEDVYTNKDKWYGNFYTTTMEIKYCPFCGATLKTEDI